MQTLRNLVLACLWLWLVACSPESPVSTQAGTEVSETVQTPFDPAVIDAAQSIQAQQIEQDIRILSADDFQGRGPGTEGDTKTQQYLIQRLQAAGVQPGAADGWLQSFSLVGLTTQQPPGWSFTNAQGATREFRQAQEFIVGSGVQQDTAEIKDAQLVFVGYGIQAPEYAWDDYKGVDVRGKVLVMLNNDPHQSAELFQGETRLYYGRWTYKYEIAAKLGAAGVIIIHTDYSAGYPWQVVQTSWSGAQFELPNDGEPTIAVKAWMTEIASANLLAFAGFDLAHLTEQAQSRDFTPVDLGLTTSLSLSVSQQTTQSANVLGLIPGRDPVLREQAIVYTAHHDHLGVNLHAAEHEDAIYNNASGVASVLAIGQAFQALAEGPRRSILLAFVGAEEQGLLGSKYYARQPTFAHGNIAANINMDGGQVAGRSNSVSYIGYGRSSIDQVADTVAQFQGRYVVGDENPSAGYFYRSDHFSLAAVGVPSLNFRGGTDLLEGGSERGREISRTYIAATYHQPSDEVTPLWQFAGLTEDAQYGFYAGYLLANQDDRPSWRAGDEFEAARLQALAALEQAPEESSEQLSEPTSE